jgi:hypothetical protein
MVVSPKSQININYSRFASRLTLPLRWIRIKYFRCIDRALRFQDLYDLRFSAIERYAQEEQFSLFGKGWTEALENWPRVRRIKFKNSPCECKDKLLTMSHYRFSLCFENCIFPGYVTEKIFDSFFAGAVPVYYGAPDIGDFVPEGCFIDFRHFKSLDKLWSFLTNVTESEWHTYRQAIRSFLISEKFVPFRQETVAANLLTCLIDET